MVALDNLYYTNVITTTTTTTMMMMMTAEKFQVCPACCVSF